jgi:hypothetical protein
MVLRMAPFHWRWCGRKHDIRPVIFVTPEALFIHVYIAFSGLNLLSFVILLHYG